MRLFCLFTSFLSSSLSHSLSVFPLFFLSVFLSIFFLSSLSLTVSLYFIFYLFFYQVRDRAAILLRAFATMTDEADLKCLFDEPMPMYVTPVQ